MCERGNGMLREGWVAYIFGSRVTLDSQRHSNSKDRFTVGVEEMSGVFVLSTSTALALDHIITSSHHTDDNSLNHRYILVHWDMFVLSHLDCYLSSPEVGDESKWQ